ncbi:MAG: nucleotide exchange factor GrpE [Acidobacteriota bacterium]
MSTAEEPEIAMADNETSKAADQDDRYELDMDEGTGEIELQAVIEDAVAAVERHDADAPDAESADEGAAEVSESAEAGPEPVAPAPVSTRESEIQERLLRTLADFDNFRKRTEREKETMRKHAATDVLRDMLGGIDNLERAMASAGNVDELKQGLEMVLRQQHDVLKRHGVEPVAALDQPFDPTYHEAVGREEKEGIEVATVTAELQRGYRLHDRLLRPAMVYVAVPARRTAEGDADA